MSDRPEFDLSPAQFRRFGYRVVDLIAQNTFTRHVVDAVQRNGRVFLTATDLHGMTVLRVCIVNFRTTATGLSTLLDVISEIGQALSRA